jgi:hypothetical protein
MACCWLNGAVPFCAKKSEEEGISRKGAEAQRCCYEPQALSLFCDLQK